MSAPAKRVPKSADSLRADSPSAGAFRGFRRPAVLALVLAAAVAVIYLKVGRYDFVQLDDPTYAGANRHVRSGLSFAGVKWAFAAFHDANWIPLTWLSLMLDSSLWGVDPAGYHETNVFLHVANTLLLFGLLTQATRNSLRSAFVAALFGLHPLHVESVAWIAERKDVLSTLFGLLSFWAYIRHAEGGRWWNLAASFACFVLSLMAKQTLVTLPFVFLLFDYWPLARLGWAVTERVLPPAAPAPVTVPRAAALRLVLEKVPFLAVSAVFSVIAVMAQRSEHAVASFSEYSLGTRLINALVAYGAYLLKTVAPFHLAAFYPHPGDLLTWRAAALPAAVVAIISVMCVMWIRKLPFLFVGWAWYLGTLVPTIGLVQIGGQQMADRYTYFPLIGLFLAIAWTIPALVPASVGWTRAMAAAAVACVCLLAAVTFVQIGYWRDSVTLFRHALAVAPNDPFVLSSLGYALVQEDRADEGLPLLEAAVRVPPPSSKTHFGLAMALQKIGRLDEAASEYEKALALDDTDEEAHNNLAVILSSRRQYAEARRHLLRAIEVKPDYVQSYVNLGVLSVAMKQYAEAIAYSQRALALDPTMLGCHFTIAVALRAQGRLDEAISQYRYLVAAAPEDRQARMELARTMALKRQAEGSSPEPLGR